MSSTDFLIIGGGIIGINIARALKLTVRRFIRDRDRKGNSLWKTRQRSQ